MGILKFIRKYKVRAKKLWTVIVLTIIEIIGIIWLSGWIITPAILMPLAQFVAIFEHKDVWEKLSKKEKAEITLSEEDLDNFVKGIIESIIDGLSIEDLLLKIKDKN